MDNSLVLVLLSICMLPLATSAKTCQQMTDHCTCKLSDSGKIISLRGIDSTSQPKFQNIADTIGPWLFDYNPCTQFNDGPSDKGCSDALVCQHSDKTIDPVQYFLVGGYNSFSTSVDAKGNVVFSYQGSATKKSEVTLLCDINNVDPIMSTVTETDTGQNSLYSFTLTTKCACPDGCAHASSKSLSTGSILVILFFVFVLVYFIGGFLLLKFYKKKEGTEAIPQYEFWKDFPVKVKDGFIFTKDTIKNRKKGEYEEI